jgi:hypothetical protein
MDPTNVLAELQQIPTGDSPGGGGDGFKRMLSVPYVTTSAGLVLTAGTTPAIAALETNFIGWQAAASSNVLGSFRIRLPGDYDPGSPNGLSGTNDYLKIKVHCVTNGSTDAPTLTCTAYRSRTGKALSSALTVKAISAAVPKSAALPSVCTIDLSGNGCMPGDVLWINLTSTAHTTDAINIYSVSVDIHSNLVFTDMAQRLT